MRKTNLRLRRLLPLIAAGAVAAIAVAAVANGSTNRADAPIKVGLIQEDHASAEPWSAALHDAAVAVHKKDPSVTFTETYQAYNPQQALPVAQQFLSSGYGVVIFHSFFLDDVARTLAKQYPKVPMSVASFKPPQGPNLSIEIASYLQIGYADCWLLSKLSKTGTIGFEGAQPIPYATEILRGCKLGAKAANRKIKLLVAYSNSFTDQQATYEQVKALVDKGADGVFPASATEDSIGGYKLCEQRKINCTGWAADSRQYAPHTSVMSAIINWEPPLRDLVAAARAGKVYAKTWDGTFGNKGLLAAPFKGAPAKRVPVKVQAQFKQMLKALGSGKIKLPKSKAHPCCP